MKSSIGTILLAASLVLAPAFARAAHTEAHTAAHTQEFTLKNGMKIIVNEDHRAPIVAHMIWYRVGSMDERNGVTGVAHALEHMMFKGTKKLKPGEFSRRVAQLGGRENAFTSKDYTAYFQQVEKSKLEAVMALEADRMENLTFDPKEFSKEIRVVMEERRLRTDDQPIAQVQEALYATAFAANPYRHPVIGWPDDLQHLTVGDVKAWYEQWYAPNNATMVVSGDVNPQQVRALAEKYFGRYPAKDIAHNIARIKPQNEPPQHGIKRVTIKAPAENPYVVLAFKVPALRNIETDSDPYALSVLAAVLDGYDNARLTARLVRTDKVANEVGADYSGIARGPVLFLLDGVPAAGTTTQQLEKLLRGEVERIAKDGVSEAELKRVKTQLIAGQIYKRDSVFGQAMEIGVMEMAGLPYTQIDRLIEKLRAVTPQQVQAAAQKYFGDDALTVATLVPLPLSDKRPAQLPSQSPSGPLR
jgi:zinc protease